MLYVHIHHVILFTLQNDINNIFCVYLIILQMIFLILSRATTLSVATSLMRPLRVMRVSTVFVL